MCTGTIPGKHRPKKRAAKWFEVEREAKWFEAKRAPGSFQQPLEIKKKIPTTIVVIATLMDTPRKNIGS
jgi:hypothetical protein